MGQQGLRTHTFWFGGWERLAGVFHCHGGVGVGVIVTFVIRYHRLQKDKQICLYQNEIHSYERSNHHSQYDAATEHGHHTNYIHQEFADHATSIHDLNDIQNFQRQILAPQLCVLKGIYHGG